MDGHPAPPLQFPTLMMAAETWEWPRFPFPWGSKALQVDASMQPGRIETCNKVNVEGTFVGMDPSGGALTFVLNGNSNQARVPLARLRRLTLTNPIPPAVRTPGAPEERMPEPTDQRDYELVSTDPGLPSLKGRTLGVLEQAEGLYLFEPVDDPRAVLRVFVPRAAYAKAIFGQSIKEAADALWVHEPDALLQAIERQDQTSVLPIGQSLLALGLITEAQLQRLLAEQPSGKALGSYLMSKGLINQSDLWTALAHKMRYPLVDLSRFPIDLPASLWPTLQLSLKHGALPLMLHGQRLIVAVDRPANAATMRNLAAATQRRMVPVFARQHQILAALENLAKQNHWSALMRTSTTVFEVPN